MTGQPNQGVFNTYLRIDNIGRDSFGAEQPLYMELLQGRAILKETGHCQEVHGHHLCLHRLVLHLNGQNVHASHRLLSPWSLVQQCLKLPHIFDGDGHTLQFFQRSQEPHQALYGNVDVEEVQADQVGALHNGIAASWGKPVAIVQVQRFHILLDGLEVVDHKVAGHLVASHKGHISGQKRTKKNTNKQNLRRRHDDDS